MNRRFDFYEYAGFIIPGTVVLMAIGWLFPDSRNLFSKDGVTLGELGLFAIMAYAAGQLVQAIGNYLEWLWWKPWGGMPSGSILSGKHLTPEQHQRLVETLRSKLGGTEPGTILNAQRSAIVREIYAEVLAAGKAARIDTFSGNYGLMRGISAAFLVTFILAIVAGKDPVILGTLAILFLLALHRMHRYSQHYAMELFVQYLALRRKKPETITAPGAS
jgi:hypothetical protein